MLLAAEEFIASGSTGITVTLVIVIVGGAIAWGAERASTRHRIKALEDAQKADNEWRSQEFKPWRRKIDRFYDRVTDRLEPDAARSRGSWAKTDDH